MLCLGIKEALLQRKQCGKDAIKRTGVIQKNQSTFINKLVLFCLQ